MSGTLFDKVWDGHVVSTRPDGTSVLFVDRHLIHELTSPQAFDGLRAAGRRVRHPELTFATEDHIVATLPGRDDATFPDGVPYVQALRRNAAEAGITLFKLGDVRQGIVHVIAPEQAIALPGTTLVCGDSHTCTVGGLGALAFGIGTSEIEHVLATQTLVLTKPRRMRVRIEGWLGFGVTAKDVILAVIGRVGAGGGAGHAVEYAGSAVAAMSVEERLTVCNMSIELGARIGMIAPDDTVFEYLSGRPYAPKAREWDRALVAWRKLQSDDDARFDREVEIDAGDIAPQITWGTSPQDTVPVNARIPRPESFNSESADAARRALAYMALEPGTPLEGLPVQKVFIGSCTNSRLSDLRAAADVVRDRRVADGVKAMVVPGSTSVRRAAEAEGLHRLFIAAGFEWREAGCSMCCAVNGDIVAPGERCVSTSNRNFEGRQGSGARTHLVSPASAAAAAVTGHITDVRKLASHGVVV